MNHNHLIKPIISIMRQAGAIILRHYKGEIQVEIKADESPVTSADLAANAYIMEELVKITDIAIVSEEEKNQQYGAEDTFFLVDPLDGTKSYIKRTGEFTVNIGLIQNGVPVLGMVYIPVQGVLYYTGEDGAYKWLDGEDAPQKITVSQADESGLVVMASQSHLNKETQDFIDNLQVKEFKSAGSSLKFCYVADGTADIYPRFGPTMEWDTAAAHAVLLAAGGTLTQPNGASFTYGKADYRNGYFIAKGL